MTPSERHFAELRKLQERIDDLEEENRCLRAQLGLGVEAEGISCLRAWFGLSPQEARVVLCLYHARGRLVPKRQLELAMPPVNNIEDRDGKKLLTMVVLHIRRKTRRDFIHTHWGQGFSMPPRAQADVRRALESPAEERAA